MKGILFILCFILNHFENINGDDNCQLPPFCESGVQTLTLKPSDLYSSCNVVIAADNVTDSPTITYGNADGVCSYGSCFVNNTDNDTCHTWDSLQWKWALLISVGMGPLIWNYRTINRKTKTYALFMVDPDAGEYADVLHWMVKDIRASDLINDGIVENDNTDAKTYQGPSPPGGETHRYQFRLYEQTSNGVNTESLPRTNFNLVQFLENNNLCNPVASFQYKSFSNNQK